MVSFNNVKPLHQQLVVRPPRRDLIRGVLGNRGIGSLIHYPGPVHLQEVLLRPTYVGLSPDDMEFIARVVVRACSEVEP